MSNSTPAIKYETVQTKDMGEPAFQAMIERDGKHFGELEGEYEYEGRIHTGQLYLSNYGACLDFDADEPVDSYLTIVANIVTTKLGAPTYGRSRENARTTMARLKRLVRIAATETSALSAMAAVQKVLKDDAEGASIKFITHETR